MSSRDVGSSDVLLPDVSYGKFPDQCLAHSLHFIDAADLWVSSSPGWSRKELEFFSGTAIGNGRV